MYQINCEFFVNEETMELFRDSIPKGSLGKFSYITTPSNLADRFTIKKLLKLYMALFGKEHPEYETIRCTRLAVECYNKINSMRKVTKIMRLRERLKGKKTITRAELSDFSGYDNHNTMSAMSFLNNRSRTNDNVFSVYNKESKSYTIFDTEEEKDNQKITRVL